MNNRDLWTALGIAGAVGLAMLLLGCGSGSDAVTARSAEPARTSAVIGHGSETRACDGIVFDGPGPGDWRVDSDWIGPLGFAGPGPGPDFSVGGYADDGLYLVKTPTLVAGHRPVTVSLAPGEARRAGLLGLHPEPAYASITYRPCPDKPRTVFPAGFLLRDRRPVLLMVRVGDGPVRSLAVGGPGRARRPEVAARAPALRAAVVRGALGDFNAGTGAGPARFPACLAAGLRRILTTDRLIELVSVYRRQGQPYASQALNRVATPIGDGCGGRRWVPELIAAGRALGGGATERP